MYNLGFNFFDKCKRAFNLGVLSPVQIHILLLIELIKIYSNFWYSHFVSQFFL